MAASSNGAARIARRWPVAAKIIGFVLVIAILVTVAIVANGFDVKQTPLRSSTIWAINKSASETGTSHYARVNTRVRELDTVKPVAEASAIVQSAASVVLLTDNGGKYVTVDQADPQELTPESKELRSAPSGTPAQVVASADYVAYLTDGGSIYVGALTAAGMADPRVINPFADDTATSAPGAQPEAYVADRVALGSSGLLFAYSARRGSVVGFDLTTGKRVGDDAVAVPAVARDGLQLTAVGDAWALYDGNSTLWTPNVLAGTPVAVPGAAESAPVIAQPAASGASVYLASTGGLYSVPLAGGPTVAEFTAAGLGTPAAPTALDGVEYAAWLPASNTAGGTLFSSDQKRATPLDFAGQLSPQAPEPVFRVSGSTMILNDDANGWVWTAPDGGLVPSSQNWRAGEADSPLSDPTEDTTQDVVQPKPPTAVDDTFGVRPGDLVSLPVLLNDSDPNLTDVLTVDPGSVDGLDPGFGTAATTTRSQRVAVRVAEGATGTASFTYAVTDGLSKASTKGTATVTLTVVDDTADTAPEWCGDSANGCAQTWPSIEVAPGGSGSVNVLDQWVDPEGDAVFVQSVAKQNPDDRGDVGVTSDGRVFFQDQDAGDSAGGRGTLSVTIADARGRTATKSLAVTVSAQPTLVARPLAVQTRLGDPLSIDPTPYLTGASGVVTVTQAVPSDPAITATPDAAGTGIDVTSSKAGTFVVRYDLTDAAGQSASAQARVTVLPDDKTTITTAPVTIFVRPGLDTTVDVFSAVANPAARLLVIGAATARPAVEKAVPNNLTADVVGHGLLRVTGSTGDGQPGLIGHIRYTVSDGSTTIDGVATVVLLAAQSQVAPIAVDDAVTVRAGAQVDIPVLANDVAVDGGTVVLNPDPAALVDSSADVGGLAFASGADVRYLAPLTDGVYTIGYRVYAAGAPTRFGSGTVQVTVTKPGENQDPRPRLLQARVVAGQSVQLPFDGYGVDPDGDTVQLDRIAAQPKHGTATINSRGDEITYTAFADSAGTGFRGTDEFRYRVKDPDGGVGVAVARVGVVDSNTGSTPVTFTDYVEVQQGEGNVVEVEPAANDVDPLGKPLTVTAVTPFAPTGSAEYASLGELIETGADGTTVRANRVRLGAGTSVGAKTFRYEVTDGLNPAVGYIVVNVIAASVPDVPQVTDSYVSVDDRATFATAGLDVVTGKVSWLSGDANAVTAQLIDPPAGYTLKGRAIAGPLPTGRSQLVTFRVTGVSSITGASVSSYGFLRVPGPDDIILSLKASAASLAAKENGPGITFAIDDFVSTPVGSTLEVDAASVRSVARGDATCAVSAATTIRYTAGAGAPYSDACLVPVKLDFQSAYTPLLIPLTITPERAVPRFNAASLSGLLPGVDGDVHTLDLATMVTWDGPPDAAHLAFTIDKPNGKSFVTKLTGSVLSVRARGGVPGGTKGVVTVHFAGTYRAVASVGVVNLSTSAPPPSNPRGGSTDATCFISDLTCDPITVIGLPGEANELGDAGLKVVASAGDAACPGFRFAVRGTTQIVASWTGEPNGLACTTSFVVEDVNGFRSAGDRNGTISWSFEGVPHAPASITQASYGDGRINLTIDPGRASDAYPKLSQFLIRQDDADKAVALCNPNGSCPVITGLTNLEHHRYSAFAVNENGEESPTAATVEAWSYAKPSLGSVTVTPTYDPAWTDPRQGLAQIVIAGSEKSVTGYKISGSTATVARTGAVTTTQLAYRVGPATIKITPVTSSDPPNASGATAADAANSFTVKIASLPAVSDFTASATSNSVSFFGLTADRNSSDRPLQVIYAAFRSTPPTCSIDGSGGGLQATGGDGQVSSTQSSAGSATLGSLEGNETYTLFACVSNGFGLAVSNRVTAFTVSVPPRPPTLTYTVAHAPTISALTGAGVYGLTLDNEAAGDVTGDAKIEARWSNWDPVGHATDRFNVDPQIAVSWCVRVLLADNCSPAASATPSADSAIAQVRVVGGHQLTCTPGGALSGIGVDALGSHGTIAVTSASYLDLAGVVTTVSDGGDAPADAVAVTDVHATLTWTAGDPLVKNLDPYSWTVISAAVVEPCLP